MLDGCYLHVRPDGEALIIQWTAGRPVDVNQVSTSHRPKRLTRKRLGDSITQVIEERRRERELRFYTELAEIGRSVVRS